MEPHVFPSPYAQHKAATGTRRIDRLSSRHEWAQVNSISQIRRNDVFRMFEPDGAPVALPDGRTEFVARSDAAPIAVDGEQHWAVEVD